MAKKRCRHPINKVLGYTTIDRPQRTLLVCDKCHRQWSTTRPVRSKKKETRSVFAHL